MDNIRITNQNLPRLHSPIKLLIAFPKNLDYKIKIQINNYFINIILFNTVYYLTVFCFSSKQWENFGKSC